MTRTTWQLPPAERPLVSAPRDVKGARFLVILVSLLLLASWLFFKAFIVASAVAGLVAAVFIRRWHTRHPGVVAYAPRTNVPEINLSRIPVGGDVAGLIFAAGSVAIVIIGVPAMAWYFVSALLCATLLACGLFAYRSAHAARVVERPLGLN
jgi:4-hydroxybenzoate polyprenyltransferase